MSARRTDRLIVRGPAPPLRGVVRVPGDKSIAQRAVLLAARARGISAIENVPDSGDVSAALACVAALGASVVRDGAGVRISGDAFAAGPDVRIDCGGSGTAARLLLGLLAGRPGTVRVDGDASLRRRPMRRVVEPLRSMGATITGGDHLPLDVLGRRPLVAREHRLPVASAQLKSALLFAGLAAEGRTVVREPLASRDHTERLLPVFGVAIERLGDGAAINGPVDPAPARVDVPGDVSTATILGVAALLVDGSDVTVEETGVNSTRTGALDALTAMAARFSCTARRTAPEPTGALRFESSPLRAVSIAKEAFPRLLDEVPILAVAAACARGLTRFFGIDELRVKESDRIEALSRMLAAFGIDVEAGESSLSIRGGPRRAATVDSMGDHRIAMAATVLALATAGESVVEGISAAAKSFPGFVATLRELVGAGAEEVLELA